MKSFFFFKNGAKFIFCSTSCINDKYFITIMRKKSNMKKKLYPEKRGNMRSSGNDFNLTNIISLDALVD